MPSLKEYRNRIAGVQNTQRITSAMKMVAAAKLRRAHGMVLSARPYAIKMNELIHSLAANTRHALPEILAGRKQSKVRLYIVVMTDRGLCGPLNGNLSKKIVADVEAAQSQGLQTRFLLIGRKANLLLGRRFKDDVLSIHEDMNKPVPKISETKLIVAQIQDLFESGEIDQCRVCYNQFVSMLSQEPTIRQIIPIDDDADHDAGAKASQKASQVYDFEPSSEGVLEHLLPRFQLVQIYQAMVENYTSELAARMTSMDSATRNADKMVESLTLEYNRQRQSGITKELIEIVSGATALEEQ